MKHLSFYILANIVITACMTVILSSCVSSQPSCYDNPRNMSCMTATQLEKELSK